MILKDSIVNLDCLKIINNVDLKKFKNSKVLILGANGFLPKYIIAALNAANIINNLNCKITCCSLNNPRDILKDILKKNKLINFIKIDLTKIHLLKLFKKKKFDFIFHCATYAQPSLWMKKQTSTIILNTTVLKFFLEKARKEGSSLIFFSSVDVYGRTESYKYAIGEDFDYNKTFYLQRAAYAGSKRVGEALCRIYSKKFKSKIYVVRPAHTYGPGISVKDKRAMAEFIKKAIYKRKINLLDQGKAIKTYGYISDITEMFLNIVQYGKKMTYNTTGLDYISIANIAKIISKKFNDIPVIIPNIASKKKHIGSDNSKVVINSKRYRDEFKPKTSTGISEGVEQLINWNLNLLKGSKNY